MACSPAHPLPRVPSRRVASRAQRLRAPCAGGHAPLNIPFARVPATQWRTPTPGSLDQRLASAPSVDPDSTGIFTPSLRLALRCGRLAAAGRHPHRPRTTKRVSVERMSAFSRTIAILRPDNWPVLARESGSLPDRDRHCFRRPVALSRPGLAGTVPIDRSGSAGRSILTRRPQGGNMSRKFCRNCQGDFADK
jgi:hypothetical protein